MPAPGDVIADKYEVERVLGQGGMGFVVAARHRELGQRVAIKFMLAEMLREPGAAERFLREARAAVALASPHVARVLDVGRLSDGAPYMVMEYLSGEDLSHMLRRVGPLQAPAAVGLLLQACDALVEAHALGIVHRDLKPANLFVTTTRDGAPLLKILDFGISKAGSSGGGDAQALTASGIVMGSPGYMSPEQVRSARDVDARSDVWALGVILYELLTGVSPFIGESLGDTFAKIVTEDAPPLRQRRPDVPAGLAKAVERCLQRKRDDRTASVAMLVGELAEFAPSDSAPLVERIRRISHPGQASSRDQTMLAPNTMTASDSHSGGNRIETGPAWLRSATVVRTRRQSLLITGAIVALTGVVALAGLAIRKSGGAQPTPSVGVSPAPAQTPTASALASSPPKTELAPPVAAPPPETATPVETAVAPPAVVIDAGPPTGHHTPPHVGTRPPATSPPPSTPPAQTAPARAKPTSTPSPAAHEPDIF